MLCGTTRNLIPSRRSDNSRPDLRRTYAALRAVSVSSIAGLIRTIPSYLLRVGNREGYGR
jgi:hypothetical protein